MKIHVAPIIGAMFGFELFDDEEYSYIVVDLVIIRIMFIREIGE